MDTNDCMVWEILCVIDDLRSYFSAFGDIENASVMYHHDKHHSRGFGFVLFKSASSINAVMRGGPHIINGKKVSVWRVIDSRWM